MRMNFTKLLGFDTVILGLEGMGPSLAERLGAKMGPTESI